MVKVKMFLKRGFKRLLSRLVRDKMDGERQRQTKRVVSRILQLEDNASYG